MKRHFRQITLGLLSIVSILATLALTFYFWNPIAIYEVNQLKWIPILIAAIAFYVGGYVNKNSPVKLLPILLLPVILFQPFNFFYFPFALVLISIGIIMLVVTNNGFNTSIRKIAWICLPIIFLFFLIQQPLILLKDTSKYNKQGELENATVLWDFSSDKPQYMPEHMVHSVKNNPLSLDTLKGKIHFISFWAGWCAPCIKEQPKLEALKASYKQNDEVVFIDISFDESKEKWIELLKKYYPSGRQYLSEDSKVTSRALGFQGIPTHLIVKKDGSYKKYPDLSVAISMLNNLIEPSSSDMLESKPELTIFLKETEQKGQMGSLSVYKAGKEIYSYQMGYSNVADGNKVKHDTKFRIASISKTFTAAMVLQAIQEGKLNLDEKLSNYFPNIPNASSITIKQLLKHQSGLYDLTQKENFDQFVKERKTRNELLEYIISNSVSFQPGEKTSYSSTNYILLSMILEKVYSMDYGAILDTRIVKPLRLKNTYYGNAIGHINDESHSYEFKQEWKLLPSTDLSIPLGAGGIVSTPADVNKFYQSLFQCSVVDSMYLEKMMAIENGWGMGLSQLPFPGKLAYGHPGNIDGFQSIAVYFPEEKLSICYISNGEKVPFRQFFFQLLKLYLSEKSDPSNS